MRSSFKRFVVAALLTLVLLTTLAPAAAGLPSRCSTPNCATNSAVSSGY